MNHLTEDFGFLYRKCGNIGRHNEMLFIHELSLQGSIPVHKNMPNWSLSCNRFRVSTFGFSANLTWLKGLDPRRHLRVIKGLITYQPIIIKCDCCHNIGTDIKVCQIFGALNMHAATLVHWSYCTVLVKLCTGTITRRIWHQLFDVLLNILWIKTFSTRYFVTFSDIFKHLTSHRWIRSIRRRNL